MVAPSSWLDSPKAPENIAHDSAPDDAKFVDGAPAVPPPTIVLVPPAPKRITLGLLAGACLVLVGFGLDKGELACEQAAVHLSECCPDFDITRMDCTQEGGCTRTRESSAVALEESECIRAASCDDIKARRVCERLDVRVIEAAEGGGPDTSELYEVDWLCD